MSAAELLALRKEAKEYIDNVDESVLIKVCAILESNGTESSTYLTPDQEAVLDETLELDKKGLLTYSSWEEVKDRITSKK